MGVGVKDQVGYVRQTQRLINGFGAGFLDGVPNQDSSKSLLHELKKNAPRIQLEADIAQQQHDLTEVLMDIGIDFESIENLVTAPRFKEPNSILPKFPPKTSQGQINLVGDIMWEMFELNERIIELGRT